MSRTPDPGERHPAPSGAPEAERTSAPQGAPTVERRFAAGTDLAPGPALAARTELVLARLREEIRRIERRPGRRGGVVACGIDAVDTALASGGFARGALTELAGGPACGKTAVALALVARLGEEDLFAWVDGRGELYPPAAAARGVDLGRLLLVRPLATQSGGPLPGGEPPWRGALWACEAVLASGAFAAVVMDVPLPPAIRGGDAAARRLQAAAERGGAVGLWLAGAPAGLRLPGAVRLEIATAGGRIVAQRPSGGSAGADPAHAGGGGRAA